MITIRQAKKNIDKNKRYWQVQFMDFVDDFRRNKDLKAVEKPFALTDRRFDALLASTIEYLCDEMRLEAPAWVWAVPSLKEPWFLSGMESLKAIAIVESPVFFRRRKIFVLENFLYRV